MLPAAILLAGMALLAGTSYRTNRPFLDSAPAASTVRDAPIQLTLMADGTALASLADRAEAVRARLLATSGIGAVALRGLETSGLEVIYAPARLAQLGISPQMLAAAVQGDAKAGQPGRIILRRNVVQGGLQAMVDLPVRSGRGVFRLGDIATVARTILPVPVSTLTRNGQPAVRIVVTPVAGGTRLEIDHAIAAIQAGAGAPGTRLTADR